MEHRMTIISGQLSVTLTVRTGGVSLSSVEDRPNAEKPFRILSSERPLFFLTAENSADGREVTLRSDEDFPGVEVWQTEEEAVLSAKSGEQVPGITVIMRIRKEPGRNRLRFETALDSANDEYILTCCDYPAFWFDVADTARFLAPYGCGEEMKADSELYGHEYRSTQEYPSYGASFQFMAYWDTARGRMLYYGLEDPAPASKRFSFIRETNDSALCIKASMPLQDTDRTKNGQSLAGACVWQLGDGDWYDAALLYRSWMEKEASWLPETGPYGRKDSAWLEEIDAWWLVHIGEGEFADGIIEAAKDLGVKTAVHLYLWHEIPFDNDYPHYFPEKKNVRKELEKIQAAGIRVIPYINGRLWDTHDRGTEDWEFTKCALPYATKDRRGTLFTESYSSKESDGSPVVLSIMCPSTPFWQRKLKGITDRIMDDIGFDGVYIDQIAAAKPQLCADPSHSHPAGGGTWWNASYNAMIRDMKNGHPDKILATECTAEMFMKNLQAYLSWLWVRNDQLPVFPVLYSDKVHLFGVAYGDLSYADAFTAQSLLYGMQMGWLSPKSYRTMPHKTFYKKAVSARKELHRTLSHGVMLRPPVLKDDAPRLHYETSPHAYMRLADYPAVQGAQWMEKETGCRVLLLANAGETDANVRIRTDFPDGTYELAGDARGEMRISGGEAELRMPALSVAWVRTEER